MALTVSPQIRILALVGLLLAVGFGGAMHVMGGGDSGSATAIVPSQNSAVIRAKHVAAKASADARHTAKAAAPKTRPATKAKAAPAVKTAPAQAVKPARGAEKKAPAVVGFPGSLGQALAANRIVVAVVYNPQSEVDAIAFAEARAGAALAGSGFVGLSVLSHADVGKLTEELGVLPDPAVLVFTRPAKLSARIDGFADKETVAQAAENAAQGS